MRENCSWPAIVTVVLMAATAFISSLLRGTGSAPGCNFILARPDVGAVRRSPPGLVASAAPLRSADFKSSQKQSQQQFGLPIFASVAAALAVRSSIIRRAKGKPQTTSGVRVRKPKNNALRNCSIATFEECTTRKRYEPLVFMYKRRFARPAHKPIMMATRTARQSGHLYKSRGRHARKYRIIDFGRTKRGMFGEIETIEYDPYRNARICLVRYEDGERRYILHALGFFVGQQVISAVDAPPFVGNAMPLDNVPIGTMIHNVEMHPGNSGQMVRAAGCSAIILAKDTKFVTVRLPSSEVRLLNKDCWCTVGKMGRVEHRFIKLGKAGKRRQLGWRPHVRGKAKNACDHPHGGGEGRSPIGQKHPKTPFGRCAKGLRTRRPTNPSTKYILIRRKKKSGRAD